MSGQTYSEITSDDKVLAALAYVFSPVVPIVVILMDENKDRYFLRTHCFQALLARVALIVLTPLTLGCFSVFWFVMLYWAYKAYNGDEVNIPLITDFVRNQGWV